MCSRNKTIYFISMTPHFIIFQFWLESMKDDIGDETMLRCDTRNHKLIKGWSSQIFTVQGHVSLIDWYGMSDVTRGTAGSRAARSGALARRRAVVSNRPTSQAQFSRLSAGATDVPARRPIDRQTVFLSRDVSFTHAWIITSPNCVNSESFVVSRTVLS